MRGIYILLVFSSLGVKAFSCPVVSSVNITQTSCPYSNDGAMEIFATGTGILQYSLDGVNFQTSNIFTGLVAGTYFVTITSQLPCTIVDTVYITTSSTLNASGFVSDDTLYTGEDFLFTSNSFGAVTWTWDFGDGNDSTDASPVSHSYLLPGPYSVTLSVSDGACNDFVVLNIFVAGASSLLVPNVFTPNNDDINDFWIPVTIGMQEFHVTVMNRYGEVVKSWEGPNGYWDGYTFPAGVPCSEGTYFYFLEGIGYDGFVYKQSGTVTLLR